MSKAITTTVGCIFTAILLVGILRIASTLAYLIAKYIFGADL